MTGSQLKLRCVQCGTVVDAPQLHCARCDGLLQAQYNTDSFTPSNVRNLFAFQDWLPMAASSDMPIGASVYRSEKLGRQLGLKNLAIAFSGYAPEIGATNPTGSFKDFEATPTILYYREHGIDSLILASAGNTARAFAYAATVHAYPVTIVIPEKAYERLWIPCKPADTVRLVVLEGCDDYAMAIQIASLIGRELGIANEGGARNVARRDGMSTALLEYARQLGDLPTHYFQAIGSGTGAIATWEASLRLLAAGVGSVAPQLHLSQNAPFTPIHDAWTYGKAIEPDRDRDDQLRRIAQIDALVLANRMPPYSVPGGVRDALASTQGRTYAVTNAESRAASNRFAEAEGLPIGPAAAVAVASLVQAIEQGQVKAQDTILLHITGNNDSLLKRDFALHKIDPAWTVRPEDVSEESIREASGWLLPVH